MKKLYLIDYENAHWCGGQLSVVVWAESADEAVYLAEEHMQDEQWELFSQEYDEEPEYAQDCSYSVNSVEEFNEQHEAWKFFKKPDQAEFYPVVGNP